MIKRFSTVFNAYESVKSFDKMPGPRGFNIFNYLKFVGEYRMDALHRNGMLNYSRYGPIVHEKILPGVNLVHVFDPDDIAVVFNQDGPGNYPRRRSHLALKKYRLDRPEMYQTAGLLPSNGEEWWKIRSELQKDLSSPKCVRNFLPTSDKCVKDFIQNLPKQFDKKNEIDEMLEELSRVSLELLFLIAFDERLDSFSESERSPSSRSTRLMKGAEVTNQKTLLLDQGFPLWKFFETSDYKKLREAQEFSDSVTLELVTKRMKNPGDSLIDQYLKNPKLDVKDIHAMVSDLLLGGVHTTSFTLSFALYHISNNRKVQDLIFEEAKKILPDIDDEISQSAMNSDIPYTRAVLKETFRLNPISVGVGRICNNGMVLGGYKVPKDAIIITQNLVACRLEKNFADPLKFKPERWLKTEEKKQINVNPYLVLPFGHGMRSCIARRFAEQNILVTLLRLMRCYKIEWRGSSEPLDIVTNLINQPSRKITLRFEKR